MTNLSVDEFLGESDGVASNVGNGRRADPIGDTFDPGGSSTPERGERLVQAQPTQATVGRASAGPSVQPGPDSLGPVLLGLFPCDTVLDGTHRPCLSFVGVRFQFTFDNFPAVLDNQFVAALWRLPVGEYALEVGLLDFAEELLASSREDVALDRPTVYVSMHRLVDVPLDQPGIYRLAARCNGQLITMQPIGVEQRT